MNNRAGGEGSAAFDQRSHATTRPALHGLLAALISTFAGCGRTSAEPTPASDGSGSDASANITGTAPSASAMFGGEGGPVDAAPTPAQGDEGGAIANAATTDGPCAVGVRCDTSCTDTNSDPGNCGACDRACGDGSVCSDGLCQATCGAGFTSCSGACVDLTSSPSHCGACGASCGTGLSCQNGQCLCPGITCRGQCVDQTTDPHNCGGCGYGCAFIFTDDAGLLPQGIFDAGYGAARQFCSDGICENYCPLGTILCGRSCVHTVHDNNNCGQCGVVCNGGATCNSGTCVCTDATHTYCNGVCVDTQASAADCGDCGVSCPAGVPCMQGACAIACPSGQIACGSSCFDPSNTKEHCGLCNQVCGGDLVCVNAECVCPSGTTDCGGSCFDLAQDSHNCGSCGSACPPKQTCVTGRCQ